MKAMARTDINVFAKQIADYITKLNGEAEGFEIIYNGYIAFINYETEYRDAPGGDSYCGVWESVPELVSERTTVADVWDPEGNECPEIAKALQALLD